MFKLTNRQQSAIESLPPFKGGRDDSVAFTNLLDRLLANADATKVRGVANGTKHEILMAVPTDADYTVTVTGLRYFWTVAPASAAGTFTGQAAIWDHSAGSASNLDAAVDLEGHSAGWNTADLTDTVLEAGDVLYVALVSNNADLVNAGGLVEVVTSN